MQAIRFVCTVLVAISTLAVAPLVYSAAHTGKSTNGVATPPSTASAQVTGIPAVALSYHGQYLATITRQQGSAILTVSDIDGSHRQVVAIPGGCEPSAIRWASNWDQLAVLTSCPNDSKDIHASGALWVLDFHDGKPVRRLAGFDGTASQLQWRSDGGVIAFLYTPIVSEARRAPLTSVIMAVPTSGGSPQVASPAGLDIHEFYLSRYADLMAYTATPVASPSALPKLYAVADGHTRMVYDPATAAGALRGLRISSPRWSYGGGHPSPLLFFGESAGSPATDADLYLRLGNSKAPIANLTKTEQAKPEWFKPFYTNAIATRVVGDSTLVIGYSAFDSGAGLRHKALLCTIPGIVTDGHGPGSLAMEDGRVAYFEYPPSGGPAVLRVGQRWVRTGCKPRWTIDPASLAMNGTPHP